MAFPTNPSNGDTYIAGGVTYIYDSTPGVWKAKTFDTVDAAEALTKIKTVDGSGSGLDADTLDGLSSSSFLRGDSNQTINANLTVTGGLDVSADALYVNASNDRVGMGTSSPSVKLDINSTDAIKIPVGTTAQRPSPPQTGMVRMNTTAGSLEFYDGTTWIFTNLIPVINSISGTIYNGAASNITLSVTNSTDTIDVKYYEGGVLLASDDDVSVSGGNATSAVPSAVYNQSAGDVISIQIINEDGTPSSNSITKTIQGLPTGGSISVSGGYRYHTFNSSGTFSVPSGFSATVDYLIVGGGGSGGYRHAAGAGAGGMLTGSTSVSQNNYGIVVGAGATAPGGGDGTNGSNSSAFGLTAIGGGGGGGYDGSSAGSGGSGGGQARSRSGPGSGTSGQGNSGGTSVHNYSHGGGGGKSQAGGQGNSSVNGAGGNGAQWVDGNYYAGGGGGGSHDPGPSNRSRAAGGTGGGGRGGTPGVNSTGENGTANTGGGGGGAATSGGGNSRGGNGGSGIVKIRYAF